MGYAKSRTFVYGRLEWKMGKMCDGGREREYPDTLEYWDILFLEAWDVWRCSVRRAERGGEVIRGGKDGWFGFVVGDVT